MYVARSSIDDILAFASQDDWFRNTSRKFSSARAEKRKVKSKELMKL